MLSPDITRLLTDECARDRPRVALPRAEVHLAIRFGPNVRNGLDVHALGPQEVVKRKTIRSGQRTVMARLQLGAHERILGVPAHALTGGVIPLEDLWGTAQAHALIDQLAEAESTQRAAEIIEAALAAHIAKTDTRRSSVHLARAAASRLARNNVTEVAADLGVSERHLRRIFGEVIGMSPKRFAKLERFRRAVHNARGMHAPSWAHIAADVGYYDQAHLIGEFHAIAGATPQAFLGELAAGAYHA